MNGNKSSLPRDRSSRDVSLPPSLRRHDEQEEETQDRGLIPRWAPLRLQSRDPNRDFSLRLRDGEDWKVVRPSLTSAETVELLAFLSLPTVCRRLGRQRGKLRGRFVVLAQRPRSIAVVTLLDRFKAAWCPMAARPTGRSVLAAVTTAKSRPLRHASDTALPNST